MRYLILSDIHSNLEALEKCLALAGEKYDAVLCLGDLVGYGPDPNAVIERIRALAKVIVRGNHDKACCGLMDLEDFNAVARIAAEWTRTQLTPEHFEFLRSLPGGPIRWNGLELVHGSPVDEDEYIMGPPEAIPAFQTTDAPLIFFGHTHCQGGFLLAENGRPQTVQTGLKKEEASASVILEPGVRYLVNPGSTGQPRDGDWRSGFAIFDQGQHRLDFYRTPYDLAVTQRKMRQKDLPEPLVRRLEIGR